MIRDGVELENTALDCRVCHQRASETPTLLMRELEAPWTHFFYPRSSVSSPGVSGSDLMNDYLEAKGDELYAAMPPPESRQLDPTARDRLIEYLRGDPSSLDPDGVLDRAARLGMTGGGGQDRCVASAL